jgi:aryl-alcohol dehydrogenase (NADP+)
MGSRSSLQARVEPAPRRRLLGTDVDVHPLCLGGNVFGWSADEAESFAVLDAYAAAGGNFVDTADAYSSWAPGNVGGESETIFGRWMKARGARDRMVVATKVGKFPGATGLSARTIASAAEASLRRLQTDRIDLYYAHVDDEKTPLAETLAAFDRLVKAGKVRFLGASNHSAARLAEALAVSRREGLARYVAAQDHHHLVHRSTYEGPLAELCVREGLSFLPYYALAQGFLSGKYRPGAAIESVRSKGAGRYLDAHGERMLAALDGIALRRGTTVAAVALAWLLAQRNVVAPIASARTPAQLAELLPVATLELARAELATLDAIR